MSDPNADLVARAVQGQREALVQLLETHGPAVRRAVQDKIPKRWRALLSVDDIMQQTYLDAFLGIERFKPQDGSLRNWLTAIAHNVLYGTLEMLEAQKRGGRRRKIEAHSDESYVALYERLAAGGRTPSQQVAGHEARQALVQAIQHLPPTYRQIVQLYDLNGQSAAEVAQAVQRTPGATYMLRARAHRMLRQVLGTASQYLSDG